MYRGTAYVLDPAHELRARANLEMIELEPVVDESDRWLLAGLVEAHVRYTQSALGRRVLDNWDHLVARFVKVMPTDEKRVREARGMAQGQARRAAEPGPAPGRSPRLAIVGGS